MDKLREDVRKMFKEFAGKSMQVAQLESFLEHCGFQKPPGFKIREFVEKYDIDNSGTLEMDEFMQLFSELDFSAKYGAKLTEMIRKKENIFSLETSSRSAEGTKHSATEDEVISMAQYVNMMLANDPDLKHVLPVEADSKDLFTKVHDGILMCKLVNAASPGTIDIRAINLKAQKSLFQKQENHVLMLNSVASIGIQTINMDSQVMLNGVPHLILSLVWQIVKKFLLAKINLKDNPYLSCLLLENETLEEFLKLSPEEILLRWMNYQLAKCEDPMVVSNLSSDLKDSKVYAHLLKTVSPHNKVLHDPSSILSKSDLNERAEMVLQTSGKMGLPRYLTPKGITSGNSKLNLAFVASIFNMFPNLEVTEMEMPLIEETREEKMYRNWMNSLGANPFVYHLYDDLSDGQVLLFLMNQIKPGHVPDSLLNKGSSKLNNNMRVIETCNNVIKYAQQLGVNTTTCSGTNIRTASENREMFLGIVWQLMRAYTISVLVKLSGDDKKMDDIRIIQWANSMVGENYHISSFSDHKLKDSNPIAFLIEAIKPQSLDFDLLKPSNDPEEQLANAQYCVSIARKIGARVYALPEDIMDLKSKMIMTIYACLMALHLENNK